MLTDFYLPIDRLSQPCSCERELAPLLNPENVLALYQAAEYHQAKQLLEQCEFQMCVGGVQCDVGRWVGSGSLSVLLLFRCALRTNGDDDAGDHGDEY